MSDSKFRSSLLVAHLRRGSLERRDRARWSGASWHLLRNGPVQFWPCRGSRFNFSTLHILNPLKEISLLLLRMMMRKMQTSNNVLHPFHHQYMLRGVNAILEVMVCSKLQARRFYSWQIPGHSEALPNHAPCQYMRYMRLGHEIDRRHLQPGKPWTTELNHEHQGPHDPGNSGTAPIAARFEQHLHKERRRRISLKKHRPSLMCGLDRVAAVSICRRYTRRKPDMHQMAN